MADRIIENDSQEVPEIPEVLESVLLFALDEAKAKMLAGEEVVPFTALAVKENLFIESHPGGSPEECFALAQHTVEGARGADAYGLCYDGYVDTDDGMLDVLIAEGGVPGEELGFAIGYLYRPEGEGVVFEEEPVFIGEAPNFMGNLVLGEEGDAETAGAEAAEDADAEDAEVEAEDAEGHSEEESENK